MHCLCFASLLIKIQKLKSAASLYFVFLFKALSFCFFLFPSTVASYDTLSGMLAPPVLEEGPPFSAALAYS